MKTTEILRPRDAVQLRSGNTVLTGWFVGSDTLRMRFTCCDSVNGLESREFYKGAKPGEVYEVTSERPTQNRPEYWAAPHQRLRRRYWHVTRTSAPHPWAAEVHA